MKDKWRLLPAFLKVRGLVQQHLVTYDYLVNVEMQEIVAANKLVTTDAHPHFYFKFLKVHMDEPAIEESMDVERTWANGRFSPQECRLRDISYTAPIRVDVEYTIGARRVIKRGITIGCMPVMLKSSKCILHQKTEQELARMGECPCDPGGYFVIKGNEKVILVQEQLSKNRIIVDVDSNGQVRAAVTSSTVERKSKTTLIHHKGTFLLRHNSLSEDIPIVIAMKAMGVTSDQEVVQLVGSDAHYCTRLKASLLLCSEKQSGLM